MKYLLPFIKMMKTQILLVIAGMFLAFLTVLSSIGLLSLSGWFISSTAFMAIAGYQAATSFNVFIPASGVRFFSMMRIVNRYGDRLVSHEATFKLLTEIRVWFYKKLEPLAPAHLIDNKTGELLSRWVNDVQTMENLYIRMISPVFVLIMVVFSIVIFFSFFSFKIAFFTGIMMLLSAVIVPVVVAKLSYKSGVVLVKIQADLKTNIVTYIQAMGELKIFGKLSVYKDKILQDNDLLINEQKKIASSNGIGGGIMTLLSGITVLVVIYFTTILVNENHLHGVYIALLILGVLAGFEAVMPLPMAYQFYGKTVNSAKSLLNITETKATVIFNDIDFNKMPDNYTIEYKNISFSYPNTEVFKNYTLNILNNKITGIIGKSGNGKSTLINLLARVWDVSNGSIEIDGINIKNFSENQLRSIVDVMPQKPYLFSCSIKENLLIANPLATDNEIWKALKVVELSDYILTLDDGIDTSLSEHGMRFSGGQQKRIALARIISQNKPIWVLDEPTEGLDAETEYKIFTNLSKLVKNKTIIIVTHNKSILKFTDNIVEL